MLKSKYLYKDPDMINQGFLSQQILNVSILYILVGYMCFFIEKSLKRNDKIYKENKNEWNIIFNIFNKTKYCQYDLSIWNKYIEEVKERIAIILMNNNITIKKDYNFINNTCDILNSDLFSYFITNRFNSCPTSSQVIIINDIIDFSGTDKLFNYSFHCQQLYINNFPKLHKKEDSEILFIKQSDLLDIYEELKKEIENYG